MASQVHVITSYSIHYTKLYEVVASFPSGSREAWELRLAVARAGATDLKVLLDAHSGGVLAVTPLSFHFDRGRVYELNPEVSVV